MSLSVKGNQAPGQILDLHRKGHSIEEISTMLEMDIDTITVIVRSFQQLQKLGLGPLSNPGPPALAESNDIEMTAEEIFKKNQARIAQKIIAIAMTSDNDSAAAKCAIYAREEGTGRNSARANREGSIFADIGKAMIEMATVKDRLKACLEQDKEIINV